VVSKVLDSNRLRFAYEQPEDPAPARQLTDGPALLGGDACRDEVHKVAALADHPESAISGVGDFGGQIDYALKHYRKRKL
jgi:hypothetical protein